VSAGPNAAVGEQQVGGCVFAGTDRAEEIFVCRQDPGECTERVSPDGCETGDLDAELVQQTDERAPAPSARPDQRLERSSRERRIAVEHRPKSARQHRVEYRQLAPCPQILNQTPVSAIEHDQHDTPMAVGRLSLEPRVFRALRFTRGDGDLLHGTRSRTHRPRGGHFSVGVSMDPAHGCSVEAPVDLDDPGFGPCDRAEITVDGDVGGR
jgi:hypothetical protein